MNRSGMALAAILLSQAAHADNWDVYAQWFNSHNYEFDSKAFTRITCDATSSQLDDDLSSLLATHPAVKAAKAIYKLSVDNTGHIQIEDPPLQLRPVNPDAAVEVPLIQEMVQSKYQVLAAAIHRDINGLIESYLPPDRAKGVIQKFVPREQGPIVTMKSLEDDSTSIVNVDGPDVSSQTIQSVTFGGMAIRAQGHVTLHYDVVDGKYLLASQHEDVTEQANGRQLHALVKMNVDYQMISGIRFPKTAIWAQERGSDAYGTSDNIVEFEGCKVTK